MAIRISAPRPRRHRSCPALSPGTGAVTINAIAGSTGTIEFTNSGNTYSGSTTIFAGALALSGSGTIADSSGLSLATGGTFDISGVTTAGGASIMSLGNTASGQTGTVALGAQILTLTGR